MSAGHLSEGVEECAQWVKRTRLVAWACCGCDDMQEMGLNASHASFTEYQDRSFRCWMWWVCGTSQLLARKEIHARFVGLNVRVFRVKSRRG